MESKTSSRRKRLAVFLSVLFGLFMGFLAYDFVPEPGYDLVRHWVVVEKLESVEDVEDFAKVSKTIDREIIPQIYSLAIAKIGNYNLLQFFVTFVGYAVLCYMLLDCKDETKLTNGKFIMIFILVVLGQSMLYYFSGLYNYVAINLFAWAIYLDYTKGYKKIAWIIYILSLFIHSSMLLPFALMIILKIFRGKVSGKFLIIFAMVLLFFGPVMSFLVDLINVDFLNSVKNLYDSYILANDRMVKYYDGFYLFMSITKIGITLIACWMQRKNEVAAPIKSIVYLSACTVIILSMSSIAMTRFSSLVLFASLPLIMDTMAQKGKNQQVFTTVVSATALLYLIYTVRVMAPLIQIGGD